MRQPLGEYDERYDEFELVGEQRTEDQTRPDRRFSTVLLSVVAMALFAGGLWLAYFEGTRHSATPATGGDVPLIRADQKPDKVKPDQPGGMQIPDQNVSIYNEKPGVAPVEKLLPPPEKPMPRPAPETRHVAVPPPAVEPAPSPAEAPRPSAGAMAPSAPPAPSAPTRPAVQPKSAVQPKPAAPVAAAETGKAGPVQIRLASVRTPDEARVEWARLKYENADLLGGVTARAVRTDLGDKGIYYRVEAGPFENAAAASRLCSELKRRGLGCILAR